MRSSISFKIDQFKREEKERQGTYDERFEQQNIVSPYMLNTSQRKFAEYIFGESVTAKMELMNALAENGTIPSGCPTSANPAATESYIDEETGQRLCREPTGMNSQYASIQKVCPPGQASYPDESGIPQCLQRIKRGRFVCPPAEQPQNVKQIVLRDGTGICVSVNSSFNQENAFGQSLFSDEFDIDKITGFLNTYKTIGLVKPRDIFNLNGMFRSHSSPEVLGELLHNSGIFKTIAPKIKFKVDSNMANIALYIHARDQLGKGAPTTLNAYARWFGGTNMKELFATTGGGCELRESDMTSNGKIIDIITRSCDMD